MQRKRLVWKLRESELVFAEQTLVGGLVPVAPGAAPDGAQYEDPHRAYSRAMLLEEQGASFVVLGAEVLRAGKPLLTAEEQTRRVIPVLKKLRGEIGIPVAVATTRAETAQRALEMGAEIIYDQSAASFEPQIAKTAADASGVLILGHMRGTPERWAKQAPVPDPIATVLADLDAGVHRARMAHLLNTQLAVEPGFNMGKRREENVAVAARVFLLNRFELPVCVNVATPGVLNEESSGASLAVATSAVLGAAHMLIAFDVPGTLAAAAVADAIGRVKAYEASVLPKEKLRETPGFGKRPLGRESRPPREDEPAPVPAADTRRPRFEQNPTAPRAVRAPVSGPPARTTDRPPAGGDHPPSGGDRPPRREGPPRPFQPRNYGRDDRPPRGFNPRGDRPPMGGGRPPRRDFGPRDQGGPKRFSGPRPPRGPKTNKPGE
ncbi:MAG: dihydropteroate synthase [Bryobacterales bacterium]|nr:dihydropteroate synthase [Bryobacterales bacterium]